MIIPQKYFLVFALMRIQAPHVFAQKLIPLEFFPACIGFVPGGMHTVDSRLSGAKKGKPAANLGSTLPATLSRPSVRGAV